MANQVTIGFIILLTLFVILSLVADKKESYNLGALNQLMAKGPQDTYLSGDAWKYINPYYYMPYYGPSYYSPYYPWTIRSMIPTRSTQRGYGNYYWYL
jgi:hypothetical protein